MTAVLYCIQYTVGQAASEETLIARWCQCIHVANRWRDHSDTATFVRPWSRGASHKFGHTKSYFTTSFARCHSEIICQHNHCIDTFDNTTSHRTILLEGSDPQSREGKKSESLGLPSVFEIVGVKHIGVTTLPFLGHVTSSVTWPFESQWVISYWWSIGPLVFISNGFRDIVPETSCAHRHNAKSSLRMRHIAWHVPLCKIYVHISIFRPHFAYSLCHFHWPPMKNKGCSLCDLWPKSSEKFLSPKICKILTF